MTKSFRAARLLFALAASAALTGCGGSSPSPASSPPPAPASSGPAFTQGVFQPAGQFKDRCQIVRTGVDIEGNSFPDRQGSLLEENFWLRSWTHETYLFNNEVVDRDPHGFSDRLSYFAVLKTAAKTPSGKDKDEFHFSQPTDEFLADRNSAPGSGYGASFIILSPTVPRDVRVAFTEANSPASTVAGGQTNLIRGTAILQVDGVDLVNAGTQAEVDILNNGLFPATAGETHTFVVADPGAGQRSVTMMSEDIATSAVNLASVINTPTGDVGYLLITTFNTFASEKQIADAITALKTQGVSDLVVDLRYNGGGLLAVASELGYMIAGSARTAGKTFETLQFNADAGNLNPVTGDVNTPTPFFDTGLGFSLPDGAPLDSLDLPRVFILSTGDTCSASESVINALNGIDVEVVLIGDTTCGKPFGFYPTDNCGETYFTLQFRGVNHKSFGDYADGFAPANSTDAFGVRQPGCAVADDFTHDLGDTDEALLAAALNYRSTGSCAAAPVMTASTSSSAFKTAFAIQTPPLVPPMTSIMDSNRDMLMANRPQAAR